jgi:predicted nuclease with TOPRIM domain
MGTENENTTPNGQAPNGTDPQSQALNSNGQAPQETSNDSTLKALQDQIAELRRENAAHRRKNKEQEESAQAALEQQLKEQGQYKTLAEQREARVKELEPIQNRYSELSTLVAGQIETQIKDWPAEVRTFDPGPDASVEQRLAWLEKSKPLIEKLQQQARASQPGNAPNPRPSQPTGDIHTTYEQRLRASGKYGA